MADQHQDQLHLRGIDPLQGKKLFVRKRDGRVEEFNEARIHLAIESAFKAVEGVGRDAKLPPLLQLSIKKCADAVVEKMLGRAVRGEELEVERIQDAAEEQLMLDGHLQVARRYILYREIRRQARAEREGRAGLSSAAALPPAEPGFPPKSQPVATSQKPERHIPFQTSPGRGILQEIYRSALPKVPCQEELEWVHRAQFSIYINEGQYLNLLAPAMADFDLEFLAGALRLERDGLFPVSGLKALREECLLQDNGRCLETPQYFWMRVAMGLALNEGPQCNVRAVEFYELLSTFRFVPSEMMLCHAGTTRPQLMTCCSATSWSDLEHVTAQFGPRLEKRRKKGSTCSWLEPWHIGIWDFLQRPLAGETPWEHDLNKALWVPDLFMKRVREQGPWTLFDPADVPGLHQQFGSGFEQCYVDYERKADAGELQGFRRIEAVDLWQEILTSLAQTGQPWLGFKDAANIRSAQDHVGLIHSSTLCTAILLNSSAAEAVACSTGSINLAAHVTPGSSEPLDTPLLRSTIATAMRMLDNAIDISEYPGQAARVTALTHRPAALGLHGFQDALDWLKISYDSAAAGAFADLSMEIIAHGAILASAALAGERGAYESYSGSKWSHHLLPIDTLTLLAAERGLAVDTDSAMTQDWEAVRAAVQRDGMRNCTTTAISQTEAASRITGASPSIEPGGKDAGVYERGPQWLVECAARRQKWLDMGQTLTLYTADPEPDALSEIIMQAWEKGLKSTRQLCTMLRTMDGAMSDELTKSFPAGTAPLTSL